MNYIAEINSFWDTTILNPLSTGQVALWFGLMHINNKCNWTEWFTVSNQVLSIHTGLSRSGILKARNELKQRGLIDFKERSTKATAYKMNTMEDSKQVCAQIGVRISNQMSAQDGVQDSNTLNKQKQKLKQKKDTIVSKEPQNEKVASGVKTHFIPPTVENVEEYCKSSGYVIDAEHFINFYQSKGWMVGKNPMKDWEASVRGWASRNQKQNTTTRTKTQNRFHNLDEHGYDYEKMAWDLINQDQGEGGNGAGI